VITVPAPVGAVDELRVHRLLAVIDGSPTAEFVLRAAVTAARRDGATLTLPSVVPDYSTKTMAWPGAAPLDTTSFQLDADRAGLRLLRETVDRIPGDVGVRTVLRRGKAGPEICAEAREQGHYDTILLGARGVGRIGSLLGSISGYVLRHADTAVFVAHPPREAP
jgi:nucleotide-binding universal stress UspA family protein